MIRTGKPTASLAHKLKNVLNGIDKVKSKKKNLKIKRQTVMGEIRGLRWKKSKME